MAAERAGAVAFVDLAAVTDPELVPAALCDAPGRPGDPTLDALTRRCARRRALLVLDNCEHLVDACARWSRRCCARAPACGCWPPAASRSASPARPSGRAARCRCPTRARRRSTTCARSEAVRLFLDRAARRPRPASPSTEDAPAWPVICAGLDGCRWRWSWPRPACVPLSRRASPRRLRRPRSACCTGGQPRPRRGTGRCGRRRLELRPAGRHGAHCLRRLAVFAGGVDLEAAEAVCAGDRDARATSSTCSRGLVDRSLRRGRARPARTRYRLLETIRQYGRASWRPAAGERRGATPARRALPGAGRAGGDRGCAGPTSAAGWTGWRPSTRTCGPRWPAAATPTRPSCGWRSRSPLLPAARAHGEGRRWLTDALTRCTAPRDADRARALLSVAFLAHFEGSYATAESYASQALAAHRERADRPATARCLRLLGSIAAERGDYDRSRAAYAEAMACYEGLDSGLGQADVLQMTGFVAWLGGDLEAAEPLLEQALCRYAALSDAENVSSTRVHLAAVAVYRGDLARARWLAEQALAHFTELDFKEGIAWALDVAGLAALRGGHLRKAVSALLASLAVHWEVGDRWRQASVLDALAAAHLAGGELVHAARLSGLASALREELGVPVPLVEREARSRTQAALAERMPEQHRYVALVDGSALAVPDVLAAGARTVHS